MIALLVLPVAVRAASDFGMGEPSDPVLAAVKEATSRQDYAKAADVLRAALDKTPGNADYHNLYALALRKGPHPNMDLVFQHYNEALRLAPKHRSAHEYIGEAYLMAGNVRKAREHLAQLDRICFFGCEEYSSLKKAIREYEAKQKR